MLTPDVPETPYLTTIRDSRKRIVAVYTEWLQAYLDANAGQPQAEPIVSWNDVRTVTIQLEQAKIDLANAEMDLLRGKRIGE